MSKKDQAPGAKNEGTPEAKNPEGTAKPIAKSKDAGPSAPYFGWKSVVVAIVVVGIAYGLRSGSGEDGSGTLFCKARIPTINEDVLARLSLSPVEVRTVDEDTDIAEEFAKLDRPVVLKNSVVKKWQAYTDNDGNGWQPEDTFTRMILRNVYVSKSPTMLYFHNGAGDHPLLGVKEVVEHHEKRSFREVDVKHSLFRESIDNPGGCGQDKWMAHASALSSQKDLMLLSQALDPVEPLVVRNHSVYDPKKAHKFRKLQMWVAGPGTTTQAHYDGYHNFFAQVQGTKRFILFPPEMHDRLYLFPFLHPGALQSQVDFLDLDEERFPDVAGTIAYEARVGRGEVLYVPPLWFHHVIAETASVSFSVWSPYNGTKPFYDLIDADAPFLRERKAKKNKEERRWLAARAMIEAVVEDVRTGDDEDWRAFVRRVVWRRYLPLIDDLPTLLAGGYSKFCTKSLEDKLAATAGKDAPTTASMQEKYADDIGHHAAVLRSLSTSRGRLEVFISNWVEKMAAEAAGGAHVTKFLAALVEC